MEPLPINLFEIIIDVDNAKNVKFNDYVVTNGENDISYCGDVETLMDCDHNDW